MSKPVLGRSLGSLLRPAENKTAAPPQKGGVGILLKGSAESKASTFAEAPAATPPAPVPSRPSSAPGTPPTPLEKAAMTRQYPLLPWFIGADVLFVGLACLVALAGHAPIRWVVVVFLVVLAGITGFLAFYAIPTPTIRPESPEEKERPKIRVHFVDELPKKRR